MATPSITERRKTVTAYLLKHLNMMDSSGTNAKRYETLFKGMSDREFDTFMHELKDGTSELYVLFPNMKINMDLSAFVKTAQAVGVKLMERLRMVDTTTGETYLSPYEYLVIRIPIRRLRQFVKSKMSVPAGDTHIDALTGQVTKPDRASGLSYVETQILYARGLENTIKELTQVRGGNVKQYAQFKQSLEETGEASLFDLDQNTATQSVSAMSVMFNAMLFEHNLNPLKGL